MSVSTSIPVIACGKHADIARAAAQNMLPEYDCKYSAPVPVFSSTDTLCLLLDIHVCLSVSSACTDLPLLLTGSVPPTASDNVGSRNYSQPAAAVVLGGGFGNEEFEEARKACEGKSNVPWLRLDTSKPTPPLGPAYGQHVAERLKGRLRELESEGHFGRDGIYFF